MKYIGRHEFKLPEGTDIVRIEDLNENTEKIAQLVEDLEVGLQNKQAKGEYVSSEEMNSVTSDLASIKGELNTIKEAANGAMEDIAQNALDVKSAGDTAKDNNEEIVKITAAAASLKADFINVEEDLRENEKKVTSINTTLTSTTKTAVKAASDAEDALEGANSVTEGLSRVDERIDRFLEVVTRVESKADDAKEEAEEAAKSSTSALEEAGRATEKAETAERNSNSALETAKSALEKSNEAFQSVNKGKKKLGTALVDMGVSGVPSGSALPGKTFQWFADKIKTIQSGVDFLSGKVGEFRLLGLKFVPRLILVKQTINYDNTTTSYRKYRRTYTGPVLHDELQPLPYDDKPRIVYISEGTRSYRSVEQCLYLYSKDINSSWVLKAGVSGTGEFEWKALGSDDYHVTSSSFQFGRNPEKIKVTGEGPYLNIIDSELEKKPMNLQSEPSEVDPRDYEKIPEEPIPLDPYHDVYLGDCEQTRSEVTDFFMEYYIFG